MKSNVPGANFSGSTACVLLVQGHKIITANVGNSRAIVVNKYRLVRQLSEDHTLAVPEERLRIEESGGRIDDRTNRFFVHKKDK